jgi:hypothetical protein
MRKSTKNRAKIALVCVILILGVASPVFSQEMIIGEANIGDFKKAIDDFTSALAYSLPFNSTIGLYWSDAYIKNFPHFGVGASIGYTTIDTKSVETVFAQFNRSLPAFLSGFGGFPIPGYTVEGRLGGFSLPFDMGFKVGYLPMAPGELERFDYLLIGGDVRYAILQETDTRPAISFGMGYNYLSGALGVDKGATRRFTYVNPGELPHDPGDDPDNPIPPPDPLWLELKAPSVTLFWATSSLDFKAQISKNFAGVTPYLGIGASTGWSKAGYEVNAKVTDNRDNLKNNPGFFSEYGIDEIDGNGFSSEVSINRWSGRLFGGVSFTIVSCKLDLTALWNFYDNRYGVSLGVRYQRRVE